MIPNDGGPAFPGQSYTKNGIPNGHTMGLSKREWFAGMAMMGWLASWPNSKNVLDQGTREKGVADAAFRMADAMLAASGETK